VRGTLGLICLALVLATPTRSLSDIDPSSVVSGNDGQPHRALPTEVEVESVTVEIGSRMFTPNHVLLHHDQKTVLRFRNHDTELHTVVAKELFLSADLNVGGNGAQEFGPDGLKRVIIPPEGLVEFQFTPTRTGTFSYLCDMPGHDMKGVIVVE
jgi:plastocyanin